MEINESDTEKSRKNNMWRKNGTCCKNILQEYSWCIGKCTDQTIVERKTKPAETMTLSNEGLLTHKEIMEHGELALGTVPQATQFWRVEPG